MWFGHYCEEYWHFQFWNKVAVISYLFHMSWQTQRWINLWSLIIWIIFNYQICPKTWLFTGLFHLPLMILVCRLLSPLLHHGSLLIWKPDALWEQSQLCYGKIKCLTYYFPGNALARGRTSLSLCVHVVGRSKTSLW